MTKILAALGLCLTFFVSQANAHTNLPSGARSSWSSRLIDRCMQALTSTRSSKSPIALSEGVTESEKLYFRSSIGLQPYRVYSPAGPKDDIEFLMIHGLGNDLDSNRQFLQQAPLHGHELVSAALNGSDLTLLQAEAAANGGVVPNTPRFAKSVQGITELMLARHAERPSMRVAVVGHSMGAAVAVFVAQKLKQRGIDVVLIHGAGYLNYELAVEGVVGKASFTAAMLRRGFFPRNVFDIGLYQYISGRYKDNRHREGLEASTQTIDYFAKGSMGFTGDMAVTETRLNQKTGKNEELSISKYNILARVKDEKNKDVFNAIGAKHDLARLGVPVLVIAGEKDELFAPEYQSQLVDELRANGVQTGFEIVRGEGGDHEFFSKRAKDAYALCESFVESEFGQAQAPGRVKSAVGNK